MPCYTERTVSVELNVADPAILERGLQAAGFRVIKYGTAWEVQRAGRSATIQGGRVTVREGGEAIINQIKQAYAGEAVRVAAKRFGWTLTADKQDVNHLTAQRRFS